MANIYLGSKKKKSKGKLWLLIIILILIAIIVFFGYKYFKMNNSEPLKASKNTYAISYEDDLYFIRVINDNKRIQVTKIPNNSTFPDTNKNINNKSLIIATDEFLNQFNLKSDFKYYINLNIDLIKEFTELLNKPSEDIDGFITALKFSNINPIQSLFIGKYRDVIRKYDRETNLTDESVYALISAFNNYSITDYDKLTLKTIFNKPMIVNVGDQTYKRNYIDQKVYDLIKTILE